MEPCSERVLEGTRMCCRGLCHAVQGGRGSRGWGAVRSRTEVVCQAVRVVSDAVPVLCAQVVEKQHSLACFRANIPPTSPSLSLS